MEQPDTRPTVTLSRRALAVAAVLLTVVAAAVGGVASWATTTTFPDVPSNHPFWNEIEWAADQGIVTGYGDGTFKPGVAVSRGAAAAYLARYNDSIGWESLIINPDPAAAFTVTVMCEGDQRVLAGGGWTPEVDLLMTDSHPTVDLDGWFVRWESDGNAILDPTQLKGYALCGPEVSFGG
jgi:hypothetical protein